MSVRNVLGFLLLSLAAAGSWYLSASLGQPEVEIDTGNAFSGGYYLKSAQILGTDENGGLLYEIDAEYAVQKPDDTIEFQNVQIDYSPDAAVPWTLNADSATIAADQKRLVLDGHVRAVSSAGVSGQETEIRTPHLVLEPEKYRAVTDRRVQIRIGAHSLTATGMLALLKDNRVQLNSNVSGRFVP